MARTTALAARPVIVSLPRPAPIARRRASRPKAKRRRGSKVSAFSTNKLLAVSVAGAAVGFAGGKGYLAKLPKIGGSRMFTLGLAGFLATKYFRNSWIKAAGLATIGAAAFHFGLSQTPTKTIEGVDILGEDILGDDDVEGDDDVAY